MIWGALFDITEFLYEQSIAFLSHHLAAKYQFGETIILNKNEQ